MSPWQHSTAVCNALTYALTMQMFSDEQVMKLWKCTGEELPLFLAQVAANKSTDATVADTDMETDAPVDGDGQNMSLPSALPMKLNAHSANPVLDALKQIDHHKAVVQYLDHQIQERHRETMTMAADMYQTAEDLLADHSTTPMRMKQRVEDCLRLVKVRNVSAKTSCDCCDVPLVITLRWCRFWSRNSQRRSKSSSSCSRRLSPT